MHKTANELSTQAKNEPGKDQEKPWKAKCSFGCYHAMGSKKKCCCRCHGKLHGKSHSRHFELLKFVEPTGVT